MSSVTFFLVNRSTYDFRTIAGNDNDPKEIMSTARLCASIYNREVGYVNHDTNRFYVPKDDTFKCVSERKFYTWLGED